uniref:Uncharacterized protein n=1 Tax=Aegilops tauschii subsp. strangulata TaxID=200361 RepID=A0A453QYN3_AEGTS
WWRCLGDGQMMLMHLELVTICFGIPTLMLLN